MRFTAWLMSKVRRRDSVGYLAQDLRHGRFPGWPNRAYDLESFEDYLINGNFPATVMDSLHEAWKEYDLEWAEKERSVNG